MKIILSLGTFLLCSSLFAQQLSPVHFTYQSKKINDNTFEITIKATLDEGWHIYSQTQPKNAIAEPTQIRFLKNPLLTLVGKPKEVGRKEWFENKEVDIAAWQYANTVSFVQEVQLKVHPLPSASFAPNLSVAPASGGHPAKVKTNLNGTITYQTCTDERCLPPKTERFSVVVGE